MKILRLIPLLLLHLPFSGFAQQGIITPLWPNGVPNCKVESPYREEMDSLRGRKTLSVQEPTIEAYFPAPYMANGAAVIIFPGGGYYLQAYDWEGTSFAKWFNTKGIAAFVVKYRLPHWSGEGCREHVALDDATQAMWLIRSQAASYHLDPNRIGVMGFSAGGHLASTLSTHFDNGNPKAKDLVAQTSSRPDFQILGYPVISGDTSFSHAGSFRNLLGENPDPEKVRYFSNELQVTPQTPPAFLVHAFDDKGVPVENSIRYVQALRQNDVSATLLIYPSGGHGFAFGTQDAYLAGWTDQLIGWMKASGWLEKSSR